MAFAAKAKRCLPFEAGMKVLDPKLQKALHDAKFDDVVQWTGTFSGVPGSEEQEAEVKMIVLEMGASSDEVVPWTAQALELYEVACTHSAAANARVGGFPDWNSPPT